MIRPLLLAALFAVAARAQSPVLQTHDNSTPAAAATVLDGTVRTRIDAFFASVEKKQIDEAYDTLTKNTKIGERTDDVASLKRQTERAVQLFGDIQGHELIEVKNVGAHLTRAIYFSLGKDFPLRWRFYYYQTGDEWRLVDIRVDDRLADMFGETPATSSTPDVSNWPRAQ